MKYGKTSDEMTGLRKEIESLRADIIHLGGAHEKHIEVMIRVEARAEAAEKALVVADSFFAVTDHALSCVLSTSALALREAYHNARVPGEGE
jgi:hypothetical protein